MFDAKLFFRILDFIPTRFIRDRKGTRFFNSVLSSSSIAVLNHSVTHHVAHFYLDQLPIILLGHCPIQMCSGGPNPFSAGRSVGISTTGLICLVAALAWLAFTPIIIGTDFTWGNNSIECCLSRKILKPDQPRDDRNPLQGERWECRDFP